MISCGIEDWFVCFISFLILLYSSIHTSLLFFTSGELSGDEYKKQLINSLCSSRSNLNFNIGFQLVIHKDNNQEM